MDSERRAIGVGLLGLGVVGSGVAGILRDKAAVSETPAFWRSLAASSSCVTVTPMSGSARCTWIDSSTKFWYATTGSAASASCCWYEGFCSNSYARRRFIALYDTLTSPTCITVRPRGLTTES